jgi:hypothetical protein
MQMQWDGTHSLVEDSRDLCQVEQPTQTEGCMHVTTTRVRRQNDR